jgi:hypothetical protein
MIEAFHKFKIEYACIDTRTDFLLMVYCEITTNDILVLLYKKKIQV